MDRVAPLEKRTYGDIGRNRRRLLQGTYDAYPEYVFCDLEQFNWDTPRARTNIFDLHYLSDSGYVELTFDTAAIHRRPDFYVITPLGIDMMETPGCLEQKFPVSEDEAQASSARQEQRP